MKSFIPARIASCLTLLALVVCLTTSCDRFTDWRKVTWDHYATGFYIKSQMQLRESAPQCLDLRVKGYSLGFEQSGRSDLITVNDLLYTPDRRSNLEMIISHRGEANHKEYTYEGYTKPHPLFTIPARYFLETPIDKVELTSDIDWGEEAPRGTVLNDHFWFLGRCHDRYAKHLDDPGRQSMPSDFTVESKDYMRLVQEAYSETAGKERDIIYGRYEVILSPLSEVDFRRMDYLEPQVFLTSDSPYFRQPQTITAKTTFRDGSTDTVTITLSK